jgi:cyclopropane fatty-acyl-phospholipid synthase-like methyltransferase
MKFEEQLRLKLVDFYNTPVSFWEEVLGNGLHFHLGHFPRTNISLENAMQNAIKNLINLLPLRAYKKILDVGCGWGGPAFEIVEIWDAEVLGLTISEAQTHFINEKSRTLNFPVKALTIDVELFDFQNIGTFDVLWLYESLEHISDRRSLLINLHNAAHTHTKLAIAMNCRSPHINRELLYNEFMGIQKLDSASELVSLLEETGWRVLDVKDRTDLTLPVWQFWINNLKRLKESEYREIAEKLIVALQNTEELCKKKLLQSIQIVSTTV